MGQESVGADVAMENEDIDLRESLSSQQQNAHAKSELKSPLSNHSETNRDAKYYEENNMV